MFWVIILHGYKSLTHPLRFRWDCVMLQYALIAGLIHFALHLVQFPTLQLSKASQYHNKVSSMFYGWRDTGCSSFANSPPHIDPPIWPKDFELDSSIHCPIVKSLCTLAHCSLLTLFSFLNSGFSNQFCHIGQLHKVFSSQWILKDFFTTWIQLCSDVWSCQPSNTQAGESDEIVLCIGKTIISKQ